MSDLEQQLKAERAAREQAEKQILMDTECIERIRKAGEMAEVRLAEALQIIRFLFYHRMPLGEKIEDMVYLQEPEQHQDIVGFLASTTPPPLLAELAVASVLPANANQALSQLNESK